MHLHIVWFKRDLRIHDHQPLLEATEAAKAHNRRQANSAAVLPLYVVEPEYWQQDDASQRQWHFVRESLVDLNKQLSGVRSSTVLRPLVLLQGDLKEHLDRLLNSHQVHLYSHEETGNDWTFQRDIRVGRWCRQHGVNWQEYTQFGVLRPNKNRDHWTRWRQRFIDQPTHPTPRQIPFADVNRLKLPILQLEDLLTDTQDHCTDKMPCPGRQSGGTQMANRVWNDFLQERGEFYRGSLSSPLSAEYHCSRISPYLAWGCISLKTLMLDLHQRQLQATTNEQSRWKASLKAFESRLWWHCHFIQKLEDEPEQEWRSLHPAYRNLREHNEEKFQAWSQGRTGWPLADACMRYLNHTGWLNFRMRAMLMSLACYPLWLPWQQPARYLARQFVDYEPGIHYPQAQMQSGESGINVLRMYNPTKQAQLQDPKGVFIRRWLPELAQVPDSYIHQPWKMNSRLQRESGVEIGKNYPAPIVDFDQAIREARSKISPIVKQQDFREQADAVGQKHGSRQKKNSNRKPPSSKTLPSQQGRQSNQLELF